MELLERFACGDLAAFEALFRQFQGDVEGWVLRIVRNQAAAEDVTLEAFWRIYRARALFDPRRSFGAWARRVATNAALDYLKRTPVEVALPAETPSSGQETNPVVGRELREALERAFGRLSPRLRAAAALALIEERPYDEIAEALGISVGAVKGRVFRALRILRSDLERQQVKP